MAEDCREKILSQKYQDFIIPDYRRNVEIVFPASRYCIQETGFGYRIIYVEEQYVEDRVTSQYVYNNIPGCFGLIDMDAVNEAGISAVQSYPTLQLQGNGILIGFVDTGIDFENPVFRNADGSTRIVGIWDQTIQTGNLPEGFFYGSEYTEADINDALRSEYARDIVPSVDENGHGTAVAAIAAGGLNLENRFQGAAPGAQIAMVKLKEAKDYLREYYKIRQGAVCFQETDIMQGLYYLHRLADARNMPLVICIALGSTFGGHNGAAPLPRILSTYANIIDRCVVIGVGNEAAGRRHFYGKLESEEGTVNAELRVENGNTGFTAELWTTLPNIVTAYLVSPSGERSPSISIRQGNEFSFTFPFEQTRVDVKYQLLMNNNDSQRLFFRFTNPAEGIWRLEVEALEISDGEFHIWLPLREFTDGNVYFLQSDPDLTLTEPGSSRGAMTVSYYDGRYNSVDINSGRGYTRNRVIKPDFAAPGVQVTTAGIGGRFTEKTGSSMAAGITAGASAVIMEWLRQQPSYQGITTSQVANIIILGARQEVLPQFPNREWGYGQMDIYQSLDRLRSL